MKKNTTAKPAVKKIPRADRTPNHATEAAARLRKMIRRCLKRQGDPERFFQLYAVDTYAARVVEPITYAAASDGEAPGDAEVAFQHRTYHEAMLHFEAFATMLAGLVDCGPSVRWAGGFDALRLMHSAELLREQLQSFRDQMIADHVTDDVLFFEKAVRLAVGRLKLK